MKSVNMSRNVWNTGTVSAENFPKRTPSEITDSGQRHQYTT